MKRLGLRTRLIIYSFVVFAVFLYTLYSFTHHWVFQQAKKEIMANSNTFMNSLSYQWNNEIIGHTDKVAAIISELHTVREYFDVNSTEKGLMTVEINRLLRRLYKVTGWSISFYNVNGVEFSGIDNGVLKRKNWDNLSTNLEIIGRLYKRIKSNEHISAESEYDDKTNSIYTLRKIKNHQYNFTEGYMLIKRELSDFIERISDTRLNSYQIIWLFTNDFKLISSPTNGKYFSIFPLGDLIKLREQDKEMSILDSSSYFQMLPLLSQGNNEVILYVGASLPYDYMEDLQGNIREHFLWIAVLSMLIILLFIMIFWKRIGVLAKEHEEVANMVLVDNLTSVYNRGHFEKIVTEKLKRSDRAMLMMLDVGGLKKVNDLYGYKIGDKLLKEVSSTLKKIVGDKGFVGRFSGAEFHIAVFKGEFLSVVEAIKKINSQPIKIHGKQIMPKLETGCSLYPEHARNFVELLSCADIALAGVKGNESSYLCYSKDLGEKYSEQIDIEFGLSNAIEKNEFFFHFQPQVDISRNKIIGYELLLRWDSPQFGFVSPGVFIPIIESKGYSEKINIYVVTLALKLIKGIERLWDDNEIVKFSINLSPSVLNLGEHMLHLKKIISDAGINKNKVKIILEITESGLILDSGDQKHRIMNSMCEFIENGIGMALDDFGVEYSSLNRLIEYPFEFVKIDRCFVQKLEGSEAKAAKATIRAILSLREELGFLVIVEGVETSTQLEIIRSLNVKLVQGFYFYKPMPLDEVMKQLESGLDASPRVD